MASHVSALADGSSIRQIQSHVVLLFPHVAAEVGGRAGAVADELAALRTLLVDALRLPEAHCSDPDAVVERFFTALADIRAVLLLDAQAICDGDPAAPPTRPPAPTDRHRIRPARSLGRCPARCPDGATALSGRSDCNKARARLRSSADNRDTCASTTRTGTACRYRSVAA
jgi:hypothetical protein